MLKLTRRAVVAGAVAMPFVARAQFGSVIKIVVPFAPGGSVDIFTRNVQQGLQQRLGATIVIEYKGGASGSIGAAQAAKSPPDGNTWLFVADTHALNPALIPNLSFDTEKDLDPVLLIGTAPNVLAKHPSRGYRSFEDVVNAAKEKPRSISFASIGTGSIAYLGMVLLTKRAGIQLTHVGYRGGGPAVADALGGHVDLIIASPALLNAHLKAGALVPLVQTGSKRMTTFPDIPTAAEVGYPGVEAHTWFGVFAPSGTPRPIVDRFVVALTETAREERTARVLSEAQPLDYIMGGPEEFKTFFTEQMRFWGNLIREEGIRSET
jgi:tripartite-type tricarboxylate transporter receptor subunit TctC